MDEYIVFVLLDSFSETGTTVFPKIIYFLAFGEQNINSTVCRILCSKLCRLVLNVDDTVLKSFYYRHTRAY